MNHQRAKTRSIGRQSNAAWGKSSLFTIHYKRVRLLGFWLEPKVRVWDQSDGARDAARGDEGALGPDSERKRLNTSPEEQRWERSWDPRAKNRQEAKAGWDENRENPCRRPMGDGHAGKDTGHYFLKYCVLNFIHAGWGTERLKYTCYSY